MTTPTDSDGRLHPLAGVLRGLDECGLGRTGLWILIGLRERGPQSVADVGRQAGVSAGAASREVERLVRRGLVDRRRDRTDRRRCVVSLSTAGDAQLRRVETALGELLVPRGARARG